jgi:ArsR family transcriptional regulator
MILMQKTYPAGMVCSEYLRGTDKMDLSVYGALAEKLKVLGHPVRLCIVNGLSKKGCHVKQICEALGIPQPVISLHLSKLKSAGIVSSERQGSHVCYYVVDKTTLHLLDILPK